MDKINAILCDRSFCEKELLMDMNLRIDLGIDSLRKVELIVDLEEEFGIQIQQSDLDPLKLQTVGDIYTLVNKYKKD